MIPTTRSLTKNAYPLLQRIGILPLEMFAQKNMGDNHTRLLLLKMDMVYRELPMEEAQKRFEEIFAPVAPVPVPEKLPPAPEPKKPRTRKTIKTIVPK